LKVGNWNLELRTFLMPKSGSTIAECEDAIGINEEALRFAVADGATEAFDAKSWANRLVKSWTSESVDDFGKWLELQGREQHESWNGLKLSWYAEAKATQGSFAAFVGVQIEKIDERLHWSAVALGDSCLIHGRGDEILLSLPLSDSNSFTTMPVLAPSSSALLEKALPNIVTGNDFLEHGDTLWLLSDAVSAWFLNENKNMIFAEFVSLLNDSQDEMLMKFFNEQREQNRIKDDDIAILRLIVNRKS